MDLAFVLSGNHLIVAACLSLHPIVKCRPAVKPIFVVFFHAWMTGREARSATTDARNLSDGAEAPSFFEEMMSYLLSCFPAPIRESNCNSMTQAEVSSVSTHNLNREKSGLFRIVMVEAQTNHSLTARKDGDSCLVVPTSMMMVAVGAET